MENKLPESIEYYYWSRMGIEEKVQTLEKKLSELLRYLKEKEESNN